MLYGRGQRSVSRRDVDGSPHLQIQMSLRRSRHSSSSTVSALLVNAAGGGSCALRRVDFGGKGGGEEFFADAASQVLPTTNCLAVALAYDVLGDRDSDGGTTSSAL